MSYTPKLCDHTHNNFHKLRTYLAFVELVLDNKLRIYDFVGELAFDCLGMLGFSIHLSTFLAPFVLAFP